MGSSGALLVDTSAAQQSRAGWLRSCPAHHPRAQAPLSVFRRCEREASRGAASRSSPPCHYKKIWWDVSQWPLRGHTSSQSPAGPLARPPTPASLPLPLLPLPFQASSRRPAQLGMKGAWLCITQGKIRGPLTQPCGEIPQSRLLPLSLRTVPHKRRGPKHLQSHPRHPQ